jgi:glycosyltransferase involved in cell wall biosynthesis
MKVSAVIISLNEEGTIAECIGQVQKCCSEVILVDAGSEDGTVRIAESLGARVFVRPWEGFGPAKNFGNARATNDWILSIDADEVLTDEWIAANRDLQPQMGTVYAIDLVTEFDGHWLKHSGFYPNWKKRLFNRTECRWSMDPVHESLEMIHKLKVRRLPGKVHHFSIKSREAYREKLDRYARLGAQKWVQQGKHPGWFKRQLGPGFHFFKTFLLKLGILDGKAGFDIARLNCEASRKKLDYFLALKKDKDL